MPLNDLNKELYSSNSESISSRSHEQSQYDPTLEKEKVSNPFQKEDNWAAAPKGLSPKGKKIMWIAFIGVFVVVGIIGGIYFYNWWLTNAFHQDRVTISFEGPKEADSTQAAKYIIHYKNDNRVTLKNAEIQLNYSENFQPTNNVNLKFLSPTASKIFIGDIKSKSEGTAELNGIFYAPKDFPVYLHGELHFTPSNGANELIMENQIGVNITASPVLLEVQAPQQVVDGDSVTYVVDFQNLDSRQMNGLQIRLDYPPGFSFSSATPAPSQQNSIWYIGNLEANQKGKITIQGQINGGSGDSKDVIASLGHLGEDGKFVVYSKQDMSTHMVAPVLAIKQELEGNTSKIISAGDVLQYVISFLNTGTVGLRDAIITSQINGKILDFSKLGLQGGSYDEKTGIITWKASDVPALANINPKSGGQVRFSIPVKAVIPVDNKNDKNFTVSSIAKIDSPDIPTPIDSNKIIGSNKLELKLASKVLFETRGYYTDSNLKNSGPIPMQLGKETTFAMHWSIISVSNDLKNARVVSSLPTGLRWTGKIYPENEKITYNQRTNQIIWDAGNVEAGSGVIDKPREVKFQIGVIPQTNQLGQPVMLLNKSNLTVTDTFVDKDISLEGPVKDTQLYEDPTVGSGNSKVVQ